MTARLWRKPRILTVLLVANLVLMGLPLGGLWVLRLYESALVRQTETELIAQAAVIGAVYAAAWPGAAEVPPPVPRLAPRFAALDLARDTVLPAPPEAPWGPEPDPVAAAIGATLRPVLAAAQRTTLAAIRVMDRNGVVVASSGEEAGRALAGLEEVAAALAGEPAARLRVRTVVSAEQAGSASISRASPIRVFVAQPIQVGGAVVGAALLSRTPASIRQALWGKRWELAVLAAGLLLVAALLALFTAYTVSRPIQAVAAEARSVAAGGRVSASRPRRSAIREADELWAAIATMAATLERRADYIGSFAADVSHEFRTPLAGIRGALELLQDHGTGMTEAERAGFVSQALEDSSRLELLVRRLLELARAEAPLPEVSQSCALGTVVRAAAAPFAGLRLTISGEPDDPQVGIGAEALRGVLANLLENVRRHAGENAACTIAWRPAARDGWIEMVIEDDGPGISPANAGRVFGRFFTTARGSGGTGLGLAIARGHVEAAGGTIALAPGGRGARFVVTLPPG